MKEENFSFHHQLPVTDRTPVSSTLHHCLGGFRTIALGEEGPRRFNPRTLTEEEEADPAIIVQKFREQLVEAHGLPAAHGRIT